MKFQSHRVCVTRRWLGAAALLLASLPASAARVEQGGLVYDAVGPANAALSDRLAPLQQARGMRFLDWLADGGMLVAMRNEDAERLHRVRTPLGTPELLGAADVGARQRDVSAVGQPFQSEAVAVLRQTPGREAALLRLPFDGSEPRQLLGPEWRAERPLWAHDGQRLAFSAALRGLEHDVFLLDSRNRDAPRQLAAETGDWLALDWSLDDRFLLLMHRTPLGAKELQWLDIATGDRRVLVAMPADGRLQDARIAPDGRGVLYLAGSDFLRLQYISLDGQAARLLTPAMKRNVERYAISGDGRWLAYSYDDNGWSRLVLLDQQLAAERVISSLPAGVITALQFDRSGARLAVNAESTVSPPDVYVLDVASNALVRWTAASAGPLGAASFSNPQPVRFRSWKQGSGAPQVAALLYRPRSVPAPQPQLQPQPQPPGNNAPLPVIVYLTGEDEQPRPRFDPLLQSLVMVGGFAVVAPELHGRLVTGDERADAVRDIGALLIWIAAQPELDSSRIAIVGSGRRSAIALGALALFSDRLQRGVVVDGDTGGVPLLAIERPVLIARGFVRPPLAAATGDQLLWRLRAARSRAALFGPVGDAPMDESGARQAELARVVLDFLAEG